MPDYSFTIQDKKKFLASFKIFLLRFSGNALQIINQGRQKIDMPCLQPLNKYNFGKQVKLTIIVNHAGYSKI